MTRSHNLPHPQNRPKLHSMAGVDVGYAVRFCDMQTKLLFLAVIR